MKIPIMEATCVFVSAVIIIHYIKSYRDIGIQNIRFD
jgi:hypothetical protein